MRFDDYLAHFGIRGMRWGQRRYQNSDGTLTPLGEERYGKEGKRGRLGMKHDLNKLDREQTTAKVRYDYNKGRADKKTAKINKAMRAALASGNTKKISKLNEKQEKVNSKFGQKAKDYKTLLDNSKKMTDRIIKQANSKGMSVISRDKIRAANKGRNAAISALASAALLPLGFYGHYGTYATGKHYRVKNDGLATNRHRSGRHSKRMGY